MGDWLARVVFPDGRVLFANWHSNSCAVGDQLYAGFLPADGERERIDPETELPARPDLPVSDADRLIPVWLTCDGREWLALFCPDRNMLAGPLGDFFTESLQWDFQLFDLRGTLHLVQWRLATTVCGLPVKGEGQEVPFFHVDRRSKDGPAPAPWRDLFAQWNGGLVCRDCLRGALLSSKDALGEWDNPGQTTVAPSQTRDLARLCLILLALGVTGFMLAWFSDVIFGGV